MNQLRPTSGLQVPKISGGKEFPANDFLFYFGPAGPDDFGQDFGRCMEAMVPGLWRALEMGYDVYLESRVGQKPTRVRRPHTVALFSIHHGGEPGHFAKFGAETWTPQDVERDISRRGETPLDLVVWSQCFAVTHADAYQKAFDAGAFYTIDGGAVDPDTGRPKAIPIGNGTIRSWVDQNLPRVVEDSLVDLCAMGGRRGDLFDGKNNRVETIEDLAQRLKLWLISMTRDDSRARSQCRSLQYPKMVDPGSSQRIQPEFEK